MFDLLRRIFGVHSPSRWGMTKKQWKQLGKNISKIGEDLYNGS